MKNPSSLSAEQYKLLQSRLTGPITEPGQPAYDHQRTPWLRVVDQFPAVIVNAANAQDIVETVRFAREMHLQLAVQNTGHGVALPCNGGILLRLSGLKSVQVDAANRTATVGPGVVAGELLQEAQPYGLAYPSGQVPNVGVVGYTLGGGVGWLVRKVGAAAQAVLSATVVLADGSVQNCSPSENTDLFWAIRGGGGNFGIVTSLTVELVPVDKVFGGVAYFRIEDAPEILRFYRDWTSRLSHDTSTVLRLMNLPPKPNSPLGSLTQACAIGVCHVDEATADKLHHELTSFKVPVVDQLEVRPYPDMGQFDEASHLDGSSTYGHTESIKELNDSTIAGLADIAKNHIPPIFMVELQHLGGVANPEHPLDMAYTAPDAPFLLHAVTPAMDHSLAELAVATKAAFDSLGPAYSGHRPYNFLRGDQQKDVPTAFTPDKYARLQSLKSKFDPSNLFNLNRNIPPAGLTH